MASKTLTFSVRPRGKSYLLSLLAIPTAPSSADPQFRQTCYEASRRAPPPIDCYFIRSLHSAGGLLSNLDPPSPYHKRQRWYPHPQHRFPPHLRNRTPGWLHHLRQGPRYTFPLPAPFLARPNRPAKEANQPSRPPNILAPRLHPRIPRSPPHPPAPLLPPPIIIQRPIIPPDPLLRPHNPALPETRAGNPLRAPLLRRHDAAVQPFQEQRPLLAAGGPEHRPLHLPLFLPRRGALKPLHHLAERRRVYRGRTRQPERSPGAPLPACF